jgi:hypothetical protein
MRDEIGMRGAQDHVERVGPRRGDRGHRLDHRLDALARREQAEGEDHFAPLPAEARLEILGIGKRPIGHTVRNHRDLPVIGTVHAAKNLAAPFGHHDHA